LILPLLADFFNRKLEKGGLQEQSASLAGGQVKLRRPRPSIPSSWTLR